MKPFAYARPRDDAELFALLSEKARPKGGGIDLLDLAKAGLPVPGILLDLRANVAERPMTRIQVVEDARTRTQDVMVGASVTLAALAGSSEVRDRCPAFAEAAAEAATPPIRNVATVAGNLLQRPRCVYFRDPFFDCLKRGGKSCPSMEGDHAEGAIFGNGKCCATHPSNLATALVALDGTLHLQAKPEGEGSQRKADGFFVPPEEDPLRETRLGAGEILRMVQVPLCRNSAYLEVNQKRSFDWASVSCAVALQLDGAKVQSARVVLGAVAPVPWIAKEAGEALAGRVPDEAAARAAAEAAVKGATPLRDNGHKVAQAKALVRRAILLAAGRGK